MCVWIKDNFNDLSSVQNLDSVVAIDLFRHRSAIHPQYVADNYVHVHGLSYPDGSNYTGLICKSFPCSQAFAFSIYSIVWLNMYTGDIRISAIHDLIQMIDSYICNLHHWMLILNKILLCSNQPGFCWYVCKLRLCLVLYCICAISIDDFCLHSSQTLTSQ